MKRQNELRLEKWYRADINDYYNIEYILICDLNNLFHQDVPSSLVKWLSHLSGTRIL